MNFDAIPYIDPLQIKCDGWRRVNNEHIMRAGDVGLHSGHSPVSYAKLHPNKKIGIAPDNPVIGKSVYDLREKGIIPYDFYIWTRTDASSIRTIPLNPLFSKPLPLP